MIDDDRLLDVVGVILVVFIVVAMGVLVLAGTTAPFRQPAEPPAIDWTIERVDDGHVNVTHDGGEPVDATELVVSVAGIERESGRADELTGGESLQVQAREGQEVRLFWISGRDERVLLQEWVAP